MTKKSILVISFSDLRFDARVTRQIKWLAEKHEVSCICFDKNDALKGVNWLMIKQTRLTITRKLKLLFLLVFRCYKLAYRTQYDYYLKLKDLREQDYDWIVANDIEAVPLAFQLKSQQTKICFDAHEFAPRHLEERLWWRLLFKPWHTTLCRNFIPKVDKFCTVSNGLADEYFEMFGKRPTIITNATKFHSLSPNPINKPIKLIHHGIVNRTRKIEAMISAAELLGADYQLDLILMLPEAGSQTSITYLEELKALVNGIDNVNILEPMLNADIVPFINQYDIGLFLLEPLNFNYTFALPNKLFDFIQARLAIAIGPSIEMANYVRDYDIGVVSDDFSISSFAHAIKSINHHKIERFKSNVHRVAPELSEESNKALFLQLLENNA